MSGPPKAPVAKGDLVLIHYPSLDQPRLAVVVSNTRRGVYATNADLTEEERGGPGTFGTLLYHDAYLPDDRDHLWFEPAP